VIDCLWKHLDLCAYTGHCSAKGLAGHADYPFPVNEQAAKAKSAKTLAVPSSSGMPASTTTNSGVVPVDGALENFGALAGATRELSIQSTIDTIASLARQ
jgi:hypothetical protein